MTLFPSSPVIEITVPPVNPFLYQSVINRSGLHNGTVPVIADRVDAESVLDDRRKVRTSAHYPRNNLRGSWCAPLAQCFQLQFWRFSHGSVKKFVAVVTRLCIGKTGNYERIPEGRMVVGQRSETCHFNPLKIHHQLSKQVIIIGGRVIFRKEQETTECMA